MKNAKRFTDRQERFVHEYLVDQNASAAAARAGYSVKTKGTHAAELMQNPAIRQRIALGLGELFARIDLNALEVLKRQVQQAYLDPAKLFDAGQRAIPLAALDEDTRGGLTVTYSLREKGGQVMTVKQTPRHVALAVLQKRLENFEKLQREAFAEPEEKEKEEEARPRPARGSANGFFDVKLQLEPEPLPAAVADMQAAEEELARAARELPVAEGRAPRGGMAEGAPMELRNSIPTLSLSLKGRGPGAGKGVEIGAAAVSAAASVPAQAAAAAAASMGAAASVGAAPAVRAPAAATAPASAAARAGGAKEAASEDGPPPSPFEPGYDFKKDPNAMYGGRFTAWNRYWRERRERELRAAEEQAALLNPPPNFRVGPGKTVPVRMEPGYNPPWLRNQRQEFAIGAGECWID